MQIVYVRVEEDPYSQFTSLEDHQSGKRSINMKLDDFVTKNLIASLNRLDIPKWWMEYDP